PTQAQVTVAVDPKLGRLTFPTSQVPGEVRVDYAYGFSGDLGGGPYDRPVVQQTWRPGPVTWQHGVVQDSAVHQAASQPELLHTSIADAVTAWNLHVATQPTAFGVIAVMDSRSYHDALSGSAAPTVPPGCTLAILAADWPQVTVPGQPGEQRLLGGYVPALLRPTLHGSVDVVGSSGLGGPPG